MAHFSLTHCFLISSEYSDSLNMLNILEHSESPKYSYWQPGSKYLFHKSKSWHKQRACHKYARLCFPLSSTDERRKDCLCSVLRVPINLSYAVPAGVWITNLKKPLQQLHLVSTDGAPIFPSSSLAPHATAAECLSCCEAFNCTCRTHLSEVQSSIFLQRI